MRVSDLDSCLRFSSKNQVTTSSAILRHIIHVGIFVVFLLSTHAAFAKTQPTLSVATSGTPSTYGNSVTFTATISSGPSGTITFYDGSTQIGTGTISSGKATCSTSTLGTGTHSITASWPGNTNYYSVTSSAITQTVNQATPTLTVASSANPSTYGGSVKFTATISSGPSGAVTFYDGSSSIGTGSISGGKATYTTTSLTAGTHSITANWPGSTNYISVTSSAITQTVNKATPTITWGTPAAITYGTALSATQLDATTTPAGSFAYSPTSGTVLNVGSQPLSVTFTPTDTVDYTTASKNVTLTVNKATPTISVATSGSPSAYGVGATFTATISSGLTGTITFYSGGSSFGSGAISGTTATCTTCALTAGSHSITAGWAGNSNYNSVTSSAITQVVSQATPQITWSNPATIVYGTALGAAQLNATANVLGSFSYSPASGTVLHPGTQTLSTTFTPSDTTDYTTATATVPVMVSLVPGPGIITTIAGNGYQGNSGDGGPAINAEMIWPEGIAVDSGGNIYIPDSTNNVVREVAASSGIITTIAGTGTQGYSGDGGAATSSELNTPMAVAVDASGNVYIADAGNNRIRKITVSSGMITTVVGTGVAGYSGDGGAATGAELWDPLGIAFDSAGNLYIADTQNSVIREVASSTGIITTVAGNGFPGYSGDGGPARSAQLEFWGPGAIAFDSSGNLYIADTDNQVVRKVTVSSGTISTIAGNGSAGYAGDNGPATSAELNYPVALSVDAAGNVYMSDYANFVIREVSSTGTITTIAGNGTRGYSGDGGPATSAELSYPHGVVVNSAGNLYIADCGNGVVRLVGGVSQPQVSVSVSPASATLYAQQTKQFTATVINTGNTAVTWSITPAGAGSINSSGLYTAPATITTQQSVTVTATSQANTAVSASATVTLMPTISISVSPSTATLYGGQSQTFSATVTNTSNTAVTWSISPAGTGSIDSSGNYTAPTSVTTQLVVTVTVTSQADTTKSATATIYLLPPCVSNGYSYVRAIIIDHTKVPNTDQVNFPFLFNSSDPEFRSTANGGHVTNSSGNDIIFSTDPTGQTKLDHEFEKYNPVTGQLIAWVRIPTLSHSADTVVYLFYGNANVTTSQQNTTGVWGDGYVAVYHLPDGTTLNLNDSTSTANNLTNSGAGATAGEIDGGASFNGGHQYAYSTSPSSLPTGTNARTLSAWIQMTANYANQSIAGWGDNSYQGDRWALWWGGGQIGVEGQDAGVLANMAYDTNWHYIVVTSPNGNPNFADTGIYVDGVIQPIAAFSGSINTAGTNIGLGSSPGAFWFNDFQGDLDEVRISNIDRSPDWTATEYKNQSSPSTFYTFSSESAIMVTPANTKLYASQSQQLSASILGPGTCSSSVIWSMPTGSPGMLSGDGLYSAPASILEQQNVTITAASVSDPTITGTAIVTLLPKPLSPTLTLSSAVQPPYVTGTLEQFQAAFANHDGSPISSAIVTFTVSGANTASGSVTTDGNGIATFTYTGSNVGTDIVQATAIVSGEQVTSNSFSAVWMTPAQPISTTSVVGRFFFYNPSDDTEYAFDTPPTAVPAFTQVFPNISFNPPNGTIPGNSTVGVGTHPFTDVTTDENGNFTGTIVAQGNGYQAGLPGPHNGPEGLAQDQDIFQAVFTGSYVVASAGDAVINVYVDNTFILGIGGGAEMVSESPAFGPGPSTTPFEQFPVMGNSGFANSIGGFSMTVHFPGPGTYPYELDYVECCDLPLIGGDTLSLMMSMGPIGSSGLPPTSTLTITPNSLNPLPAGGQQVFTVTATDASGHPVPNLGVTLEVSGVDGEELKATTNSSGFATFTYQDINPGTASVQAVALINGMVTFSNQVSVPWTLPPSTTTGSGGSGSLNISINAENTLMLPGTLQLSGSATDSALPQGDSITTTWSQVSGPGTTTFANPQQISTTASFSEPGSYELQLAATDVNGNASAHLTVAVNPAPGVTQGWIGSPAYGSAVSCIVPITVATGETLASGTLTFYPDNNPNNVTVLNANTTGSGLIGTWDTTVLNNGTYWITLQATDTNGNSEYNLDLVTVTGNCKPGRITSTVTDLVVPANGLSISIQRTYDSLNASTIGDFGYGWNLSTNVNLTVDPKGDVTFTLGGIRRTFYLTPVYNGFLPFYSVLFTPEPGMHGTLTGNGPGCSDLFDYVIPDGSLWYCIDGGLYSPPGYIYTDPSGTEYLIGVNGNLQLIEDKNGNSLTINANGITSSSGLSVPFARDSRGRITEITDPQGNNYLYSYDSNGNLASVTYPNTPQSSTYTYDSNHRYLSGTDFRGNALPTTAYYGASDTDPNGLPLNGRLKIVTDALSETTSYAYNLTTNTTTITYPPDAGGNVGTATMVYDALGDLLSSTDPLGHTTTNTYDANQNLLTTTDPLGHTTNYTYDSNGNRTSTTYPATATSTNTTSTTTYNQFSEPTSTTDELGNVRNFNYDANFNPQTVTDGLGTLASFQFNTNGTMNSGAVGFDIGAQPSAGSQFAYDTDGNMISRTDALGRTTSYTYDSLGHKLSMTEPLPNSSTSPSAATTNYTYDPFGNLTQTAAPLGRTTSSTYDGNGNKLTDTDARGKTTAYQYDSLNRLALTIYPDSTTSSKTYDFRGNVVSETDQAGSVTKHVYDLAGRQTSVTQAYGTSNATTTSYTYDNDGRKLSETDSLGHTTSYTYDAAGNLTAVSGVSGNFTYAYDNARNRVSMTDGNGHPTGYQYDARCVFGKPA